MILVIDNYDSFTYNLVQFLGELQRDIMVVRNDAVTVEGIAALKPTHIILSPGPGRPENAGICVNVIRTYHQTIPLLGVCLGHQAIGYSFGATIIHAPELMHGKMSLITHDDKTIFRELANPFKGTRYHSLAVGAESLPADLEISARTKDGTIMGLRHRQYPVEGVQFHPESFLTQGGKKLLSNFLRQYS